MRNQLEGLFKTWKVVGDHPNIKVWTNGSHSISVRRNDPIVTVGFTTVRDATVLDRIDMWLGRITKSSAVIE